MSESPPPKKVEEGRDFLVVRSTVPERKTYGEYRPWLRRDFYYKCAYCTMTEAEAQAIRFTIDHYEPIGARPDLAIIYDNLMYCCDECNIRKGNRCPPEAARAKGYRFFRPDRDFWREHFKTKGIRLEPITNTGSFTIDALDLNRKTLRILRELRERLIKCERYIGEGIDALRDLSVDQLSQQFRSYAVDQIKMAIVVRDRLAEDIDKVLRDMARSPLIHDEADPEAAEQKEKREARLKALKALYPGKWRAPNRSRPAKRRKGR